MKQFVDTNVFIYTLFPIDRQKHLRSLKLFETAASGKIALWTNEWVIAELIWFLGRRHITRNHCKQMIKKIIATTGLEVKNRQWLFEVIQLWEKPLSFVDAVHLQSIKDEKTNTIVSYDKAFDKQTSAVRRKEP